MRRFSESSTSGQTARRAYQVRHVSSAPDQRFPTLNAIENGFPIIQGLGVLLLGQS